MASERNPQQQQKLAFGVADGSARARRMQLAYAVRDQLPRSSDAKLLALLIYDQTAEGLGPPWEAGDELAMGHALGPECGRTKFYDLLRALTEAGILSVDKHRAEDGQLRRRYSIDWGGVYRIRGWPLPQSDAEIRPAEIRNTEIRPAEIRNAEIRPADGPPDDSRSISPAGAGGRAPAGARLSSCLVVLSSTTTDKTAEIRQKANDLQRTIFAAWPGKKLDTETRRFIACVAAIAVVLGGEWAEWIDYAAGVTGKAKPREPGAYLRSTLRQSLVEFAGICGSDAEAATTMGGLLRAARPLARSLFARAEKPVAAAEKAGAET